MAKQTRTKQDKTGKPITWLHKPIHLCFESELEQLHKHFTDTWNATMLALIEPELEIRRAETIKVQESTPADRLAEYQLQFRKDQERREKRKNKKSTTI